MPDLVLVHGLFGWGRRTPLYGLGTTYFPDDLIRKLWGNRGKVVLVDVGVASSDHDRACEIYAQLMHRSIVDYGAAHSKRCGHERFKRKPAYGDGSSFPLSKKWSAKAPIHLIGHSFGGNTALKLVELLSCDFWNDGTDASWVLSPLRGCTLPFVLGLNVESGSAGQSTPKGPIESYSITHAFGAVLGTLFKLQLTFPSLFCPLFDLHSEQWRRATSWRNVLGTQHPYWTSNDNMVTEVTPSYRRKTLRDRMRHLRRTFLIAVVADPVRPMGPRRALAALVIVAALVGYLALQMRRFVVRRVWRRISTMQTSLLLVIVGTTGGLGMTTLFMSKKSSGNGLLRPLGRALQRVSEPVLPLLVHRCVVSPFLRVCSYFVRRASAKLADSARVSSSIPSLGVENDGLVEIASQSGLSFGGEDGTTKRSELRPVRSVESFVWLESPSDFEATTTMSRALSTSDIAAQQGAGEDVQLSRGRWHVMRISGSDHAMGTWISSASPPMYRKLLHTLSAINSGGGSRGCIGRIVLRSL